MQSLFLNIPGLNVDANGKIIGSAGQTVKKVVKKVVKKAAAAAAQGASAASSTATAASTTAAATSAAAAANAAAAAANAAAEELAANATAEVVDQTPSALMEFLSSLDPTVTAIVVGLVLLIAFYIYRTRFSSTGQRGDTFLLLGPMGSGKTSLYFQLKQGAFRQTVTSMKENDAVFVPKALTDKVSASRFLDLPGHASQRGKLDTFKPVAKGVIFVVDGSNPDNLGKVSQLLYSVLVDPIFCARRTPIFIAVNKQELMEGGDSNSSSASATKSKATKKDATESGSESESESEDETTASGASDAVSAVAARLEGILDKTRGLQSTMSDISNDGEARIRTLGRQGEKFKFSHSTCPITVGGVSAAKGEIEELLQFVQAH